MMIYGRDIMIEIEDETFWKGGEQSGYSDIAARRCAFNQCILRASAIPGQWKQISSVELLDASQWNCSISGTTFEEVSLHNLKRTGDSPLFLWGCVFRHVKVSGRLSGIKINRAIGAGPRFDGVQPAWDHAVVKYCADVDWALDISEAKFAGGITFEAVPGHLIRRNPATQVLVNRKSLSSLKFDSLDFDKTAIDLSLSGFLKNSLFENVVLAARADSKWAKRDIAVLNMLRSEGIAEVD